jgi:hypothetical protein
MMGMTQQVDTFQIAYRNFPIRPIEDAAERFKATGVAQPPQQHVGQHRQTFDQVIFLPDKADLPPDAGQGGFVHRRNRVAIERDRAGRDALQAIDAAQECGFARARSPDDRHDLACIGRHTYRLQGFQAVGIDHAHIVDVQHRHAISSRRCET